MILGAASFGSCAFASRTTQGHHPFDAHAKVAVNVVVNGFGRMPVEPGSLSLDDTLGEPMSCQFTLVNPVTAPIVGHVVQIYFFHRLLFAGTIRRVEPSVNSVLTRWAYRCSCLDWSHTLVRRKVNRTFTDLSLPQIVGALLQTELDGEGFSLGSIDTQSAPPLVDAKASTCFELLRDTAGVTGQTMSVDFQKRINFLATSNAETPLPIIYSTMHVGSLTVDLESYRNVQHVTVKGTPAAGSNDEPLTAKATKTNDEQIAERQALEGGTGRYEEFEELVHPTSNLQADLNVMADAYATLNLSVAGELRQTLKVGVRGWGFRSGQVASVSVPALGLGGTWMIQRVSAQEENGRRLIYQLELVLSGLQRRAYESWLRILKAGKITISIPGFTAIPPQSQAFTSPGSHQWTAPYDTTVTMVLRGASGGGAGGAYLWTLIHAFPARGEFKNGGKGGNSGRTTVSVAVLAGQILDIVIGAKGTGGTSGNVGTVSTPAPTPGTAGGDTTVHRTGVQLCRANGGGGGIPPTSTAAGGTGTSGDGADGLVTVGGGKTGGAGATHAVGAQAGKDGDVILTY